MLEYATDEAWAGAPVLAVPGARKALETEISWAMHLAAGETEQEMRRRWLEHHLEAQDGRCAYCGVEISIFRADGAYFLYATVDHIVPLSKGGPDRVENTLGACRRCNRAKGSLDLEAFLVGPEFQGSVLENHPCPDRVVGDPGSPHFDLPALRRGIRVWVDGKEYRNVYGYCVSEGVAELMTGRTRTRSGRRMTLKKRGEVRPVYRDVCEALDRIGSGAFRDELLAWLAEREIPAAVRVRDPALDAGA
jgi:hypothetical protein